MQQIHRAVTTGDGTHEHLNRCSWSSGGGYRAVAGQHRRDVEHADAKDPVLADEKNRTYGGVLAIEFPSEALQRLPYFPGTGCPDYRANRRLDAMSRTDPIGEGDVAGTIRRGLVVRCTGAN